MYEIPEGSKIHFGKSAKLKRDIENMALNILYKNEFEEIQTPIFNFYNTMDDNAIKVNANNNKQMTLRIDNTTDIIKIIKCHLNGKIKNKKWFYVQSAFLYPSKEINQIGVEYLDKDCLAFILSIAIDIFVELKLLPILQISNMRIPRLCALNSNLDISVFSQLRIDKLLNSSKETYLSSLLSIHDKQSLKNYIKKAPLFLKYELEVLLNSASYCEYENIIFSPLYYSPLGYYDSLFFRMFSGNRVFCLGGKYEIENMHSCGFAIYTNEIIDYIGDSKS